MEIYKNILINDKYQYDYNVLSDFGYQLIKIMEYKDPMHGHKLFVNNYKQFYETLFEILFKCKRKDSLNLIQRMQLDFEDMLKANKISNLKNFGLYLINSSIEAVNFLIENESKFEQESVNQIKDTKLSCLNLFGEFARKTFLSYLSSTLKDKSCIKPCLDLIYALLKIVPKSKPCFYVVERLLRKEDFYLLKNFPEETKLILSKLLDLCLEINLDDREQYSFLKDSIENLVKRILPFQDVIDAIQNCLYQKFIFRSIEQDITIKEYYYATSDLSKFIDFKKFPKESNELQRLKTIFKMAISSEIFDSIQPDQAEDYNSRVTFYNLFYRKIAECLKERGDMSALLNDEIIELVNEIIEKNDFVNEFKDNSFTINFNIIRNLSKVLENKNTSTDLAQILFDLWISLFKNFNTQELRRTACTFIKSACENFPKICSSYSDDIWDFYLNSQTQGSEYFLLEAIKFIFPLTRERFLTAHSKALTASIISSNESIVKLNGILNLISEMAPEYYFKKYDSIEMVILDIFNKVKSQSNANPHDQIIFISIMIGVTNKLLLKNFNLSQTERDYMFTCRHKFLRFIFENGENYKKNSKILKVPNLTLDSTIYIVNNVFYFLAVTLIENDKYERVKAIVMDLIGIIKAISTKECIVLVIQIRKIGIIHGQRYLPFLKENAKIFHDMKNNSREPEIQEVLQNVIDLIEGRNLEDFETKLNENENRIDNIQNTVLLNGKNISSLNRSVKTQELRITNLNENLNVVNEKLVEIDSTLDEQETKLETLDEKTLLNVPLWCKDLSKILSKNDKDWMLIAKRFNFTENDIKGWLNQNDPCLSMFQEIFVQYKTSDAITFLLKIFREVNYKECIEIIEKNQKQVEENKKIDLNEDAIDKELIDNPPQIFVSYEWSSKEKAELLRKYLYDKLNEQSQNSLYKKLNIWFDDGNMGGGNNRNNRIDRGLRTCSILVCFITDASSKDQTCLNQITLAIQLNKPIIPLLIDPKLKWPPAGSLGPILSEYLFIRFFQRPNELTNDERYWPVDKFNELVMQVKQLIPTSALLNTSAKMPANVTQPLAKESPEVFISYQWGKQKEIINLYNKLTDMGLTCWLDIYQMGGGDSLYDKIDKGIRNCCVVISCVTTKYGLSANCRKELALSDSLSKPIIPILLEENMKYPPEGPMAPTLSVIKYIDFTDANNQKNWDGDPFLELVDRMKLHLSNDTVTRVTSKACIIS
jgi:hypothetical protein